MLAVEERATLFSPVIYRGCCSFVIFIVGVYLYVYTCIVCITVSVAISVFEFEIFEYEFEHINLSENIW